MSTRGIPPAPPIHPGRGEGGTPVLSRDGGYPCPGWGTLSPPPSLVGPRTGPLDRNRVPPPPPAGPGTGLHKGPLAGLGYPPQKTWDQRPGGTPYPSRPTPSPPYGQTKWIHSLPHPADTDSKNVNTTKYSNNNKLKNRHFCYGQVANVQVKETVRASSRNVNGKNTNIVTSEELLAKVKSRTDESVALSKSSKTYTWMNS